MTGLISTRTVPVLRHGQASVSPVVLSSPTSSDFPSQIHTRWPPIALEHVSSLLVGLTEPDLSQTLTLELALSTHAPSCAAASFKSLYRKRPGGPQRTSPATVSCRCASDTALRLVGNCKRYARDDKSFGVFRDSRIHSGNFFGIRSSGAGFQSLNPNS